VDKFQCLFCGPASKAGVSDPFCRACGTPLSVTTARPNRRFRLERSIAIDVFRDYLPLHAVDPALTLGEGDTPMIELGHVEERLSIGARVWAKNEAANPTASFKDRGSVVAVHKAVELGFRTIGTISTGNMAGSTAAYAAKAGLKSVIFVKEDTDRDKIAAAGVYGPRILKVRGNYGSLFRRSFEIGRRRGIYFMNSVDPYRIEGYKVTGFEIFLQLGGRAPDYVLVPVSAGGHVIGLMRSFLDLKDDGLISKIPTFVGVQAAGCSPIARAFKRRSPKVSRFPNPHTIAHAISNPDPPGGNLALRLVRDNGGLFLAVSEAAILRAHRLLAREEGLFVDPASATVLAGLERLAGTQKLGAKESIALIITGSGLKTLETVTDKDINFEETSLDGLERSAGGRARTRR
jgi:threonine synthase